MDREKVVKALECLKEGSYCECCNYKPYDDCIKRVATDAIALLKEQEPAEPVIKKGRLFTAPTCRKCGYFFPTGTKPNYCQECGQAVKWE